MGPEGARAGPVGEDAAEEDAQEGQAAADDAELAFGDADGVQVEADPGGVGLVGEFPEVVGAGGADAGDAAGRRC